jgi:hypothetical protein
MIDPSRDKATDEMLENLATRTAVKLLERAEILGLDFLSIQGRSSASADFRFLRTLREDGENLLRDLRFLRALQLDAEKLMPDLRFLRALQIDSERVMATIRWAHDKREAEQNTAAAMSWRRIVPGAIVGALGASIATLASLWIRSHYG